jgi:hypothetical protein
MPSLLSLLRIEPDLARTVLAPLADPEGALSPDPDAVSAAVAACVGRPRSPAGDEAGVLLSNRSGGGLGDTVIFPVVRALSNDEAGADAGLEAKGSAEAALPLPAPALYQLRDPVPAVRQASLPAGPPPAARPTQTPATARSRARRWEHKPAEAEADALPHALALGLQVGVSGRAFYRHRTEKTRDLCEEACGKRSELMGKNTHTARFLSFFLSFSLSLSLSLSLLPLFTYVCLC